MIRSDRLTSGLLCSYLNAVLAAQLLCVEGRAVDCVEGQFSGSREQRGRFGEELIVLRLHGDRLDEHGVTGVFVRFQFCLKTQS